MTIMIVILAGALGAVLRFVVDSAIKYRRTHRFPWTTLLINLTGSALIGLLAGLVIFHHAAPDLLTVLGTGFCGGYTTFSTASVETVRLIERRRWTAGVLQHVRHAAGHGRGVRGGSGARVGAGMRMAP